MHLSELWIYPVKGAAGVPVTEWPLDAFGLLYDRRWMVVAGDGAFITQRDRPALGQVAQSIEADALVLRAGTGSVRLPLRPDGPRVRARVWSDEVDAVDAGDEAAGLLSDHLGFAVRLLHMPEDTMRQADLAYAERGDRVSFADGFPLLVISQASLDELNSRLEEPLEMRRFRPNLVIAGAATPHAEDGWGRIRVGAVECDLVKPCARCVVTTLDPDTGAAGREPLRTLATYRTWARKVYFGQNAVHRGLGTLCTGDAVEVVTSRDPEPPLM